MGSIVLVAGARPNFMKIAPVLRALEARHPRVATTVVHTGQHYDQAMSEVFFEQLGIRHPDAHLAVGAGSHGEQTGRIMIAFEEYLQERLRPPRGVVVVGDVNSTAACALVAVKMGIPVAHVEAGLRSFDRSMPEEINRVVTDSISDLLLVSEPSGLTNLEAEGVADSRVRYVGNLMIDTLVDQLPKALALGTVETLGLRPKEYALVTLHRPSNVDEPERLAALVDFLARLGRELPIVFPVHPRTDRNLGEFGLRRGLAEAVGVRLLEPQGYRENLGLLAEARLVLTDSGGIQEETTYLNVPCITLRPNTERPVTETAGTNTVVGGDLDRARTVVDWILGGRTRPSQPIEGWDGRAAERVVEALLDSW
jgi:UDP-N-acetylglucosamine 2-epimerase (non-hydrolysing)